MHGGISGRIVFVKGVEAVVYATASRVSAPDYFFI